MHVVLELFLTFSEPPLLLQEFFTASSAEARHFPKNVSHYNSSMDMESVRTEFVARGRGILKYNLVVTVRGWTFHEMGALILPTRNKTRFTAVHITDNAAQHWKQFYAILREELLSRLATMLHKRNSLVQAFLSLRDLMNASSIPEHVLLVIHAHERTNPGHEWKYNLFVLSEISDFIVIEKFGLLGIVLWRKGCANADVFEKMDGIRLGNRMYDPLYYLLLFSSVEDGWHSKLKHSDHKGKRLKVPLMKFYSRYLFQRDCDFDILIHFGRFL